MNKAGGSRHADAEVLLVLRDEWDCESELDPSRPPNKAKWADTLKCNYAAF